VDARPRARANHPLPLLNKEGNSWLPSSTEEGPGVVDARPRPRANHPLPLLNKEGNL